MENRTLHIALTNCAMRDEKEFIASIEEGCYQRHREDLLKYSDKVDPELYCPYKYYVFGNYDIAFVSLINNYDFAQKLFIPKFQSEDGMPKDIPPYAYQIITGILNDKSMNYPTLNGELYNNFPFLGISNFKLNNGILVGNGVRFTDAVAEIIRQTIPSILGNNGTCIILHSFSWFEITLLIFSKQPELISKAISTLRSKKIKNLGFADEIIRSSSKFNFFATDEERRSEIINVLRSSDIFSDSQSYFCVQYDFFNKEDQGDLGDFTLESEIEWQIKPGHFSAFQSVVKEQLKGYFEEFNISLITGRSDYVIDGKCANFGVNSRIQRLLNTELSKKNLEPESLINHVRNIRTRVYLKSYDLDEQPANNPHKNETSFRQKLKYDIDIYKYNQNLKKLKISKQCRANVLKMFYHYKNGVRDPILSIYFFDFYFFIKKVMKEIDKKCSYLDSYYEAGFNEPVKLEINDAETNPNDVEEFEEKLASFFHTFEDALAIRVLNSYRYEDISDINLDFNSSIQQLLSMYNTLAHAVGDIFKSTNNNFIVLINDRSTVANATSINYSIYDLLTPEFIFYSLPKEILNYYDSTEHKTYRDALKSLEQEFKDIVEKVESDTYSEFLHEFFKTGIIDIRYLFVEQIRFYFSFNLDVDCYLYWTWSYAFKNSSAYNISGSFKEANFMSELTRIIFTLKMFGFDTDTLKSPLPQHETYWQRLFPRINEELSKFFLTSADFVNKFKQHILKQFWTTFASFDLNKLTDSPKESSDKDYKQCLKCDLLEDVVINTLADISNYYNRYVKNGFSIDTLFITKDNVRLTMYQYLRFIYDENKSDNGYINFLYRDWQLCTPLIKYNEIKSDNQIKYFYRIDQTGGVFFPSTQKMEEYFKLRNTLLVKLWDFSMRETNQIIKQIHDP